jgi:hypothetical protein
VPNYPYMSGQQGIVNTIAQLRKGRFPSKVDASYLQRFKLAPSNESYVISILRFLGLIDEEGKSIEANTGYFYGDDASFQAGLESALRSSYSLLFDDMGDGAFDAENAALAQWFRVSEKTSELVGSRQASTFKTLAALAGHGEIRAARGITAKATAGNGSAAPAKKTAAKVAAKAAVTPKKDPDKPPADQGGGAAGKSNNGNELGLTIRVEVNLPPGGDADTYDAIFASIKKHLMS